MLLVISCLLLASAPSRACELSGPERQRAHLSALIPALELSFVGTHIQQHTTRERAFLTRARATQPVWRVALSWDVLRVWQLMGGACPTGGA